MILIYISALIALLSFGGFAVAYQVNGVNRAIICLPISILETSTSIDKLSQRPYLDKIKVTKNLTYYYDNTIKNYTSDYVVEFYFYNSSNNSYCTGKNCNAVEVTVNAKLMYNYNYQRVMFYKITGSIYG